MVAIAVVARREGNRSMCSGGGRGKKAGLFIISSITHNGLVKRIAIQINYYHECYSMYSIIYYALWGLGIPHPTSPVLFSRTFAWSLPILIPLFIFETDDDDSVMIKCIIMDHMFIGSSP